MAIAWEQDIQKAGELTIFPTERLRNAAAWGPHFFQRILDEFNRIANENHFGVRVSAADQAPQPSGMGANVQLDATPGECRYFNWHGAEERDYLDVKAGKIKGVTFKTGPQHPERRVSKAFIFVPANPMLTVDYPAGPLVKIGLSLHELLHACGLEESDAGHGKEGAPKPPGPLDIFATEPTVTVGTDAFYIDGKYHPGPGGRFQLTGRTVLLVQRLWLLGRF